MATAETVEKLDHVLQYLEHLVDLRANRRSRGGESDNCAWLYGSIATHLPGLDMPTPSEEAPEILRVGRQCPTSRPEPTEDIAPHLTFPSDDLARPQVAVPCEEPARLRLLPAPATVPMPGRALTATAEVLIADPNAVIEPWHRAEAWIDDTWRPWAEEERARRKTNEFYERLFMIQTNQDNAEQDGEIDLFLAVGLVQQGGKASEDSVPVIEQRLKVALSPDGVIALSPNGSSPQIGLAPYRRRHNGAVQRIEAMLEEVQSERGLTFDLQNAFQANGSVATTLSATAAFLDPVGKVISANEEVPSVGEDVSSFHVVRDWTVFARRRPQDTVRKDIKRYRDLINAPHNSVVLPQFVERVVNGGGYGKESAHHTPQEPRLFLPKPANAEQRGIVKRLEADPDAGFVVQGPPGTGKSHTIANVISHYMATGRRVLVTAKTDTALQVLKEKLPESLRDFAVSLMDTETSGLRDIEKAAAIIAEDVSQCDTTALEDEKARLLSEMDTRTENIEALKRKIDVLGAEADAPLPVQIVDHTGATTIEALSAWVEVNRDEHDWFTDRPALGSATDTGSELVEAVSAAHVLREELGGHISDLPDFAEGAPQFPPAAEILRLHERLIDLHAADDALAGTPHIWDGIANPLEQARRLHTNLGFLIVLRDALETRPWIESLLADWISEGKFPERLSPLKTLFKELPRLAAKVRVLRDLPVSGIDESNMSDGARAFIGKAAYGRKKPRAPMFGRSLKEELSSIRINGRVPHTRRDWRNALRFVEWHEETKNFVSRWNTQSETLDLESVVPNPFTQLDWIIELNQLVHRIDSAVRFAVPATVETTTTLLPAQQSGLSAVPAPATLRATLNILQDSVDAFSRLEPVRDYNTLCSRHAELDGTLGKKIATFLKECVGNPASDPNVLCAVWTSLRDEASDISTRRPTAVALAKAADAISEIGAPNWAERIMGGTDSEKPVIPDNWMDAWRWAEVCRFIDERNKESQISSLNEEIEAVQSEHRQIVVAYAETAIRVAIARRIQDTPKMGAALVQFTTAIRELGKGTGIRTPRHQAQAQMAMDTCYSAIPCWIMSTRRVSETLPAEFGTFDLVIVDEASQCDAAALPALFRGRQVLVVGDDKQISPAADFIEEAEIKSLHKQYLANVQLGDLMLPGASLYDLARAACPNERIVLTEHFRCLAPLIKFSQQFYHKPLKVMREGEVFPLGQPMSEILVPDGKKEGRTNRAEGKAIVAKIQELTAAPEMKGRTIGVISLVGSEQAELISELLNDTLGTKCLEKFAVECGNIASFQGKEKNVILLSCITSRELDLAPVQSATKQRHNVAMSRARDLLFIVRSLSPEALAC